MKVEFVNEAYTSQTCSNCGLVRKGNRVKRGLYVCKSCNLKLNADINGAINIMRKVALKRMSRWSSGDIISSKRLKLVNFSV
jgi:putative transposase